jgi:transposase-like protein
MNTTRARFATVVDLSRRLEVDPETVRRWCRRKDVIAVLTPGGRGQWRIEIDERGLPVRG